MSGLLWEIYLEGTKIEGAILSEETRGVIGRFLFNPSLFTRILRHKLGDSTGVFGAAMLARIA